MIYAGIMSHGLRYLCPASETPVLNRNDKSFSSFGNGYSCVYIMATVQWDRGTKSVLGVQFPCRKAVEIDAYVINAKRMGRFEGNYRWVLVPSNDCNH